MPGGGPTPVTKGQRSLALKPEPKADALAAVVPRPPKSRARRTWSWLLAAAAAAVVIGAGAMQLVQQRRTAMCADCVSQLRSIGCAINGYSEDYDGEFPPSWRETYPDYINNAKLFKCPATESDGWRDLAAGTVTADSSGYAYVPGLNACMPGDFVVAHDRSLANHHGYGRCVVCVDAHVEWWPASREADFQRLLVLQKEAVDRWRASGKLHEGLERFVGPELRRLMDLGVPCRKGEASVRFDFLPEPH